MDKKAIVKKTGEIVNVQNEFKIMHMSFSFDLGEKSNDEIGEEVTFTHPSSGKDREGSYFTCDDGETYHEDDIVVGLDEIREYKLKNNLEI